ncbi:phenylacetate--CoA ligase family protein [Bryobacter aggregatus]|uniref:phenylacetate--CoA ligase family protein n=1 Tax=Bryobacter aggregatus TaxID=360054 RepID=UPI0004E16E7E|nr:phenylacetate--CoA ligase family protein [Bryobacter aggregatus]
MIRNGIQTICGIRNALASSYWPRERFPVHQLRLLQRLLEGAYAQVPFYRQHFDQHGFHPKQLKSLADLARVPMLQKQQIRETPPREMIASGIALEHCNMVSTSGSSGIPLRILLDQAGQRAQRVAAWRILFEHGFSWTDRTMEIRMTKGTIHPVQRLGIAPKTWLSILDDPQDWVRTLLAERPAFLVASAGTLRTLATVCPPLRVPPRVVISDGETLYPADRALIQRRLGVNPIDVYGLVELSDFAWECEAHVGFHISADSHIVEVIEGEIVVTDLNQTGMPMIRYRTGDLGEWKPQSFHSSCVCGRTNPVLQVIHGRAMDSVHLPSGRTLHWEFFHEVLGRYTRLRQWRVIQQPDQSLIVQLATEMSELPHIEEAISANLPERVAFECEAMERIPIRIGEKFRAVIRH